MLWLFALLLFLLQGLLTPLLTPLPPPDLLLLAALLPLGRTRLVQALLVAYLIGGVQDVASDGVIGLHALGLAAGVFCAGLIFRRDGFLQSGLSGQVVAVGAAWTGKWLALSLLLLYLGHETLFAALLRTAGLELLLTLTATGLLHPLFGTLTRGRERSFYL